jgi:hypothetical protein
MRGGTQAALALGVGYVLGRRRKMRMTTVLAAAAATGGLGGLGGAALRRGVKMLGSTEALGKVAPQLGELADTVRGDLLSAGKAAATAAVSNRIESLTDSLHDRAELVRDPGAAVSGAGEAVRGARRRAQKTAGDEDGTPRGEDEPGSDEPDEPDEPEAGERRSAPARRRTTRAANGGPARGTSRGRSPVARARR